MAAAGTFSTSLEQRDMTTQFYIGTDSIHPGKALTAIAVDPITREPLAGETEHLIAAPNREGPTLMVHSGQAWLIREVDYDPADDVNETD
jgi:hypothetical protein